MTVNNLLSPTCGSSHTDWARAKGLHKAVDVLPDAIAGFVSSKIDLEKASRIAITYFTVVEQRWLKYLFASSVHAPLADLSVSFALLSSAYDPVNCILHKLKTPGEN
ncbi:hypothetical protein J6590_052358 [Homalodisca vitripennis]|nr:hypothetical protein J6590_052358 [Homalodisca vitripennis]